MIKISVYSLCISLIAGSLAQSTCQQNGKFDVVSLATVNWKLGEYQGDSLKFELRNGELRSGDGAFVCGVDPETYIQCGTTWDDSWESGFKLCKENGEVWLDWVGNRGFHACTKKGNTALWIENNGDHDCEPVTFQYNVEAGIENVGTEVNEDLDENGDEGYNEEYELPNYGVNNEVPRILQTLPLFAEHSPSKQNCAVKARGTLNLGIVHDMFTDVYSYMRLLSLKKIPYSVDVVTDESYSTNRGVQMYFDNGFLKMNNELQCYIDPSTKLFKCGQEGLEKENETKFSFCNGYIYPQTEDYFYQCDQSLEFTTDSVEDSRKDSSNVARPIYGEDVGKNCKIVSLALRNATSIEFYEETTTTEENIQTKVKQKTLKPTPTPRWSLTAGNHKRI